MKIGERTIRPPKNVSVVLKRDDGDIVLTCKTVLDFEPFEQLCPKPAPRGKLEPGGKQSFAVNEPKYLKELEAWATKQGHWMILESLSATEDISWETVKMDEPDTYANYETEMSKIFSIGERVKIVEGVNKACGLSVEKMDEAREAFLATTAEDLPQ